MKKNSRLIQVLVTLYSSGKKGIEGIAKIRRGVATRDPAVGFNGVMDLLGSAGMALLLTPEGIAAGAVLSLGSSLMQNVQEYRRGSFLPPHERLDRLMQAGLSVGALFFFLPGGFYPGTILVGGISAARQVLKFSSRVPALPNATGGAM